MCGVVGYKGKSTDLPRFLVARLSELEYRGYDSAGIAYLQKKNRIKVVKSIGSVNELKKKIGVAPAKLRSGAGIGHTRWATHGGVTTKNAHPHTDCKGTIALAHNGIVENYQTLKAGLLKRGHKFKSETDSEVIAHLVEELGARRAFNKLSGLNAIVVLDAASGEITAIRVGSPLVLGVTPDFMLLSSDTPTLSHITTKAVLINDGEGVTLTDSGYQVFSAKNGKKIARKPVTLAKFEDKATLGKYPHFMLKEIFEEPETVSRVANTPHSEIKRAAKLIHDAYGTYFAACGTAAYAGLAATYIFSEIASRHVNFAVASEFSYLEDFLQKESLLIAASQSGETMDTLEAVRAARRHGSGVLALTNVAGSSLSRQADETLLLRAGIERAVVSTKAYVAKLAMFTLLAYELAGKYPEGKKLLGQVARDSAKMLTDSYIKKLDKLARKLSKSGNIYLIGRGVNYPTALEGALKIKEASYIHAEGFAGGELKHGVISLVTRGTPVIAIVANDRAREETISNTIEVKTRGAYTIGISPTNNEAFDEWIPVPDSGIASPIVSVVPLQILGYKLSLLRGNNPDKPRNLAKSVTVK